MSRTVLALSAVVIGLALGGTPGATSAAPATQPAARKPAVKRAPPKKVVKAAPAPAAPPLALASDEQKAAAELTHLGEYACEFDQKVMVVTNPLAPGYIDVTHGKQTWVMKPALSSTGALRLEENNGGRMLMIQIANKSMLMDAQAGRRVVDGCQHEKQREFERALKGSDAASAPLLKP